MQPDLSQCKGKALKQLAADLAISGRSKLKAPDLRAAIQERVQPGPAFIFSQVHDDVTDWQVCRAGDTSHTIGFMFADRSEERVTWRMAVTCPEFAERAKVIGTSGSTDALPRGSVVSYVDAQGVLKHFYKRGLPDMWTLSESDGCPVQTAPVEDWLGDEGRPPVSMHGVYVLGAGLSWPEGVEVRSAAEPEDVAEEGPKVVRMTRRQRRAAERREKLNRPPALSGDALRDYRKGRKAKQRAAKKARKKQRKRAR